MPIITPNSKVLVSGANGYLACWVVRTFLEKGYAVRGAVRSLERGAHLLELFKSFGKKFELVIVSDITKVNISHDHRGSSSLLIGIVLLMAYRMVHSTKQLEALMQSHTLHRHSA
jgi:nucleoside-diphosphate-sugar epimerase